MHKLLAATAVAVALTSSSVVSAAEFKLSCKHGATVVFEPKTSADDRLLATLEPEITSVICNIDERDLFILSWPGSPRFSSFAEMKTFLEFISANGAVIANGEAKPAS